MRNVHFANRIIIMNIKKFKKNIVKMIIDFFNFFENLVQFYLTYFPISQKASENLFPSGPLKKSGSLSTARSSRFFNARTSLFLQILNG